MSAVLASPTTILTPRDQGWDDARRAWNLAVDQHPAAVAPRITTVAGQLTGALADR